MKRKWVTVLLCFVVLVVSCNFGTTFELIFSNVRIHSSYVIAVKQFNRVVGEVPPHAIDYRLVVDAGTDEHADIELWVAGSDQMIVALTLKQPCYIIIP
jgi:hypothetical protein